MIKNESMKELEIERVFQYLNISHRRGEGCLKEAGAYILLPFTEREKE